MGTELIATSLQQIHTLSTRAVLGAVLLLICCVLVAALFQKSEVTKHYVFLTIVGVVGLATGVLLATTLYIVQNPDVVLLDRLGL